MRFLEKLYWERKGYYWIEHVDDNDCGPACLTAVLKHYGYKTKVTQVADVAKTDVNGTTLLGLVEAAKHFKLRAKAVSVHKEVAQRPDYYEKLQQIKTPFIAHLILDNRNRHYVTVYELNDTHVIAADSNVGILKYTREKFIQIFTGTALLLEPEEDFETQNEVRENPFIINLIKGQKRFIGAIMLASIISSLFGVVSTLYFSKLLDEIIPAKNSEMLQYFSMLVLGIVLLKVCFEFLRSTLVAYLNKSIDGELLYGYFNHIAKLPITFFDSRSVGSIISRFSDTSLIKMAVSSASITVIMDGLMTIIGGIVLYNLNKQMFFACFVPIAIFIILAIGFKNKIEKANQAVMESNSDVISYMIESTEGMSVIKAFRAEEKTITKIQKKFKRYIDSNFKYSNVLNLQDFLKSLTNQLFVIVILGVGGYLAIKGTVSIGVIVSFYALLTYFISPVERILELQSYFQGAMVAAERLGQIMDLEHEVDDGSEKDLEGNSIVFEDVAFRYGYRKKILEHFSLSIKEGETIALVGESGAGKSTIVKMLMRFYNPEAGMIRVGGIDIREISIDQLRRQIAYVAQDSYFFTGTFKDNLKMWDETISDEEMVHICQKMCIHDYIMSQPKGYEETLSEKANNISGGQKQRLAIARALLKKPKILILDEATSHLDTITEKRIELLLDEMTEGVTVIKIAHRLSTVKNCDKIYVLQNGKIIESGSHKQMLNNNAVYANLWGMQDA